jgi:nicotinamide-nucleotide amidase
MESELTALARQVGEGLKAKGLVLATAESCTGGWVAKEITEVPGSSEWFDRGFVTYTDGAKKELLGVTAPTLQAYGAVSEATVREMVQGALRHSRADVTLAISGIAGPGGGTPAKPVGTVHFAWALRDGALEADAQRFGGDRRSVRAQSVAHALRGVLRVIGA